MNEDEYTRYWMNSMKALWEREESSPWPERFMRRSIIPQINLLREARKTYLKMVLEQEK